MQKSHKGYFKTPVVAIAVVVVLGILAYGWTWRQSRQPVLRIEPIFVELQEGTPRELRAFYDQDGNGPLMAQDVTKDAEWASENTSVARVGNVGPTKGAVVAGIKIEAPAVTAVTARWEQLVARVPVTVSKAAIAITCAPVTKKEVRVGEQDDFITYFQKWGVPDYTYEWEAPENQKSTDVIPAFSFKTPGIKIIKVTVVDRAGTVVKADCAPLIVKD